MCHCLCVSVQSYKASSSSCEEIQRQSSLMSVKDYVESLHQNSKSTLLYGKNNVIVQPVSLCKALNIGHRRGNKQLAMLAD